MSATPLATSSAGLLSMPMSNGVLEKEVEQRLFDLFIMRNRSDTIEESHTLSLKMGWSCPSPLRRYSCMLRSLVPGSAFGIR